MLLPHNNPFIRVYYKSAIVLSETAVFTFVFIAGFKDDKIRTMKL